MSSHFGWVDFANEDQENMLELVRSMEYPEARDELGLGVIRDVFANDFFPGTSTIQTRARYMLFIPWIYKKIEEKSARTRNFKAEVRRDESRLIKALMKSSDQKGLIGKEAQDRLQRMPSSIYWSGLFIWKIRCHDESQNKHYHSFYQSVQSGRGGHENIEEMDGKWDPALPEPPAEFYDFEQAKFKLTQEEAEYLQEKIANEHDESLLSHLLDKADGPLDADFFWELPLISSLDEQLRKKITHAQNFSEIMYGAALLYNFLLVNKKNDDASGYQKALTEWKEMVNERIDELTQWYKKIEEFWDMVLAIRGELENNVNFGATKEFIEEWCRLVFTADGFRKIENNCQARRLLEKREERLKRHRARLTNEQARKNWSGASGSYQMDYRWNASVQQIVSDILVGLNKGGK